MCLCLCSLPLTALCHCVSPVHCQCVCVLMSALQISLVIFNWLVHYFIFRIWSFRFFLSSFSQFFHSFHLSFHFLYTCLSIITVFGETQDRIDWQFNKTTLCSVHFKKNTHISFLSFHKTTFLSVKNATLNRVTLKWPKIKIY